jgi:hypothetical protein
MPKNKLQLGLTNKEWTVYLKKWRQYVEDKEWTRMWFLPHHKTFRPFFKGMKFELFDKIQPNFKRYVGQEIVEVRILVNPKATHHPLMEGQGSRTMEQMAVRIFTRVYTIGIKHNTTDKLTLLEDKKQRCLVVNYYLDNLNDGKHKIMMKDVEMITKLMLSGKVSSTPFDGVDYPKFVREAMQSTKKKKKKKKTKK